ncbi:hypothetical protein M422DRAFT_118499, partial [Sphaerobolus stellatus SS14]
EALSEREIDLICGVYRVYLGKYRAPTRLSWWPKPKAWEKSGLDVGYWSSECESWYRERLKKIDENAMELRTHDGWKN